ncbi:MAG: ABC transporter substrate-binding protein [Burkholderiales bacterium]
MNESLSGKVEPITRTRPAPRFINENGTATLHLTLAVCDYEHTREIAQGIVRADGITLTPLVFPSIEEITFRFTRNLEWDVSELSFGKYIALAGLGNAPMVAIPVFPSRMHRHSAIYIRADRGIHSPKDLEGRTIGVPEWAQTAGIYVRGFLADEYGVDLKTIRWVQAGVDEAGRAEKVALRLPDGFQYQARPDSTLSAMLESGEVDAVISAKVPLGVARSGGKVTRLFSNYRAEEARLFAKTGIFPIMHLITLRRDIYEQHPWIAMNLYKAFDEAKWRCLNLIRDYTCSRLPLPWGAAMVDEVISGYGEDPYPYGIEASKATLEAYCRYAHEQGITPRLMTFSDLFPPEMHASTRV